MLSISQSGSTYHYLNWVPSERGPLVTMYGSIQKNIDNFNNIDEYYYEVFEELFSKVNSNDQICTFSLDSQYATFSTCFAPNNNLDLINWHMEQANDSEINKIMDYYHYPMNLQSGKILSIGFPKVVRQSFQMNMRLLKSKINCISIGIFSAEMCARQLLNAEKNKSYVIWKIGKKKNDEILFINNGELITYFSFTRIKNKKNISWVAGDVNIAEKISDDIINIQRKKNKKFSISNQIYLYSTSNNMRDVKFFHNLDIDNLTLLNPLRSLEIIENQKIHEYNTLPLAEAGNSFWGIDV